MTAGECEPVVEGAIDRSRVAVVRAFCHFTTYSEDSMNTNQLKGDWKQVKGKLRARWGKLTDDDLEVIAGQREQLIGLLQKRYGEAEEEIERQVKVFEADYSW